MHQRLSTCEGPSAKGRKWFTRCGNCNALLKRDDALRGEIVCAAGKLWHTKHFQCTECKIPLTDMKYYPAGNTIVCLDCHLDEVGLKCEGCNRAVYEEYLMVDEKPYHHDCFVCARCRNPMPGGQYLVLNGRYFDEDCYYMVKYHLNMQKPAD